MIEMTVEKTNPSGAGTPVEGSTGPQGETGGTAESDIPTPKPRPDTTLTPDDWKRIRRMLRRLAVPALAASTVALATPQGTQHRAAPQGTQQTVPTRGETQEFPLHEVPFFGKGGEKIVREGMPKENPTSKGTGDPVADLLANVDVQDKIKDNLFLNVLAQIQIEVAKAGINTFLMQKKWEIEKYLSFVQWGQDIGQLLVSSLLSMRKGWEQLFADWNREERRIAMENIRARSGGGG